ncbi:hypothetical protein E2C01_039705 [Portunus trituberculatus]|uniref:Uncharacterized protein n=1 Tax=Portunus trituberculatus TaxID=210409 RepID=A0A5B7FLZ8_PORTR|nr:hypothetical protein [Portunus trituberculatus]
MTANGKPIPTHGRQHLNIRIGNCTYGWKFVVADVTLPLLGADFLANYLVDIHSGSFPRRYPHRSCPG